MDKTDFLNSVDVKNKVAESAWKQAGGDKDAALELLDPQRVMVKGRFSDADQGFYGLLFFNWNVGQTSLDELSAVILNDSSIAGVEPAMQTAEFKNKLEHSKADESKMGGYTDQLENALRKLLSNPTSDVRNAVENGNYGSIGPNLEQYIASELDLNEVSLSVSVDERLKVEDSSPSTTTSSSSSSEKDVELPCQVEINPVRGLPVAHVEPGDLIYVDLKDVDDSKMQVVDQLEKHRTEDGLIPAEVTKKNATPAGNLRIEVKFDQNVRGKVSCGKDVSILVPESTKNKPRSSSDLMGWLQNEYVLGSIIGLVILLVMGIWYFLA